MSLCQKYLPHYRDAFPRGELYMAQVFPSLPHSGSTQSWEEGKNGLHTRLLHRCRQRVPHVCLRGSESSIGFCPPA